jgi:hypothetical protein
LLLFDYLYSYDTRGNHAGTPSHWKDEEILENRAIFRTVREPAELVIKPVKVSKKLINLLFQFHMKLYSNVRKKMQEISVVELILNFLQQGIAMLIFKLSV